MIIEHTLSSMHMSGGGSTSLPIFDIDDVTFINNYIFGVVGLIIDPNIRIIIKHINNNVFRVLFYTWDIKTIHPRAPDERMYIVKTAIEANNIIVSYADILNFIYVFLGLGIDPLIASNIRATNYSY